jgi:hypothetical protein
VIAQLKKDFLNSSPPKPPAEPPEKSPEKKTNKYLKTENRWTAPVKSATNGTVEDTVQSFQVRQHVEISHFTTLAL